MHRTATSTVHDYGCQYRIRVGAAEDLDRAAAIVHFRERQIVGRRGVGTAALVVRALTVPPGVRIVVRSFRVHALIVVRELSAAAVSAGVGADARHVVRGVRVVVGVGQVRAASDATRAVVLVVQCVVVVGQRVGAAGVERLAQAIFDVGGRVEVGAHAVSAPAVGAAATVGVGLLVEVEGGRVQAAGHDA
eukprot:scaffold106040_cov84-Phaeocystis_antarctica.AAC.1